MTAQALLLIERRENILTNCVLLCGALDHLYPSVVPEA